MAKVKKKTTPAERVQERIAAIVVDSEYATAKSAQDADNGDFESIVDMLECRRNEKDYDWMSDNFIPEGASIHLTDAAMWANMYFQSRDFVEVKLDGDGENDKEKTHAAKLLLNKTLNRRDLYYYHKYMRLRTINALRGHVYVLCWWNQERRTDRVMEKRIRKSETRDVMGQPLLSSDQVPGVDVYEQEVEVERPVVDQFDFDVIDPRNVFTDNTYCYSVQHKQWVIIRSESSYSELMKNARRNGYFNLDKVREAIKGKRRVQTETARETYAKEGSAGPEQSLSEVMFDVLDRYGKFWAIPLSRDRLGNHKASKIGIDEEGMPLEGAEYIEGRMTFVVIGSTKIMIRFEPTPYLDARGRPYKPIVRGWCYIHPTKDEGLSDGKYMRELQIGVNDMWNMAQDRVKLATLPTFIGRKDSLDDRSSFYIEPEHVIEVNDINQDLRELQINPDVSGALESLGMYASKMQQVTATYPHTMGLLPERASTPATAVVGAEMRTNARSNYKSMTWEYTFAQEFYWMILQMSSRFAMDETLLNILGEDASEFDADADYSYTPVSQNIELEQNKQRKVQLYDQTIGRLSALAKIVPQGIIPIIAHIVARQLELQGDEYATIADLIENLVKAKPQPQPGGAPGETPPDLSGAPVSNEEGIPMSPQEMMTREGVMGAGGAISG